MRENWFVRMPPDDGIDINSAGIYEWRIDGIGVYVGQARMLASRIRAYPNNVRKILDGRPWRKNSKRPFRNVHHRLQDAHEARTLVTVSVLENCAPESLNERERYWIARRRDELTGTELKILNSN